MKSLGSKKLDIDFGNGDDFFNSFAPAQDTDSKVKSNKLQEVKDPFEIAPGLGKENGNESSTGNSLNVMNFNYGATSASNANSISEEEAKQKLAKMGNRKAISSDDFFNDYAHTAETKERLGMISASGATQISSDMMFGAPQQ